MLERESVMMPLARVQGAIVSGSSSKPPLSRNVGAGGASAVVVVLSAVVVLSSVVVISVVVKPAVEVASVEAADVSKMVS